MTVLHLASETGNVEIINLLLAAKADVNITNSVQDTALHCAATGGNINAIKALLGAGADIKAVNKFGDNVLQCAVTDGHREATKALLNAGADVTTKTKYGDTALTYAINYNKPEIVIDLMKYIVSAKNVSADFKTQTIKTIAQSFLGNKFHQYNRKQLHELVTAIAMFKTTENINLNKKELELINFSEKYVNRQKSIKNHVVLMSLTAILVVAAYVAMPATTTSQSSPFVALAVIMTGLATFVLTSLILKTLKISSKNQENLDTLIKMPESILMKTPGSIEINR